MLAQPDSSRCVTASAINCFRLASPYRVVILNGVEGKPPQFGDFETRLSVSPSFSVLCASLSTSTSQLVSSQAALAVSGFGRYQTPSLANRQDPGVAVVAQPFYQFAPQRVFVNTSDARGRCQGTAARPAGRLEALANR